MKLVHLNLFICLLCGLVFQIACSSPNHTASQTASQKKTWSIGFPVFHTNGDIGPVDANELAYLIAQQMSLRELAAQILIVSPGNTAEPPGRFLDNMKEIPVGGIILMGYNIGSDADAVRNFTARMQQAAVSSGAGIPLYISIDHEGGTVFRLDGIAANLPNAADAGSMESDPAEVRRQFTEAANNLRELGISMNFAPVLEPLLPENRSFLRYRSYSDNPDRVFQLGGAMIEEMRSAGILPVAKHFPGSGDGDPHYELPLFSQNVETIYHPAILPFTRAVHELDLPGIMSAHVRVPSLDKNLPATISPRIQQGFLRDKIGFSGLIISDDLNMRGLTRTHSPAESGVLAVKAGVDMLLTMGADYHRIHAALMDSVQTGVLDEERLLQAAAKGIEYKLRLNLYQRSRELIASAAGLHTY
ncbi:MAG: glycoside hydrolase family 3 N-terminal domain-containing protein [Spirochaeta sp.]